MFDLEKKIYIWKMNLRKNSYIESGDILEYEGHLRDRIDHLIATGRSEEEAFREALKKLNINHVIDKEFLKANSRRKNILMGWVPVMLPNYFKTAFRQILRQKAFSLVNITGLAVGLACFLLIMMWVKDELSFDRYHENNDTLFIATFDNPGSVTPYGLGPELKRLYPEIEYSTRFVQGGRVQLSNKDIAFFENGSVYVDSDFFRMFSYPFVFKSSNDPLKDPHSIVISETLAKKYFGLENPIGKTLRVNKNIEYRVTGVIKDVPKQTHWSFSFVRPIESLKEFGIDTNIWNFNSLNTFVKLVEGADPEKVSKKISGLVEEHRPTEKRKLSLWGYSKRHLYGFGGGGRILYIYIFSGMALFVLLIACINFINLSTAFGVRRSKEIGIRKAIGADKSQLIRQFLGESFLYTFLAVLLSIFLIELSLPYFNMLTGKELTINYFNPGTILGLFCVFLLTALLSGYYPAFYLSSFSSSVTMKGGEKQVNRKFKLRNFLVVAQFSLSIILITSTFFIYSQVDYMRNRDSGINREQTLFAALGPSIGKKLDVFRNELLSNGDIESVSYVNAPPVWREINAGEGDVHYAGKDPGDDFSVQYYSVDYDFPETFGLKVVEGRYFSREHTTDAEIGYVLNERAVERLGIKNPVGKEFGLWEHRGRIIGVIKDYHFRSMHFEIEPLALRIDPARYNFVCLRLKKHHGQEVLSYIDQKWKQFEDIYPFEYQFIDDSLRELYNSEERVGAIAKYMSILAIFISCIGLFGLTLFMTEQRTKEIGIRKILGASIPKIVLMLSGEFSKWVLIANIVALPITFYIVFKWLLNFPYRIEINPWFFVLTAVLVFGVALGTVGYQCVRSAISNPVDALRNE